MTIVLDYGVVLMRLSLLFTFMVAYFSMYGFAQNGEDTEIVAYIAAASDYEFAASIYAAVEKEIEPLGYHLVVELEDAENPVYSQDALFAVYDQPTIYMRFIGTKDSGYVMIFPYGVPALKELSPVLIPAFNRNTIGGPYLVWNASLSEEQHEAIVAVATATTLYTANRCDLAFGYFDQYKGLWNTEAEPTFVTNLVDFYKSNCALLNGDYNGAIQYLEPITTKNGGIFDFLGYSPGINLAWAYLQVGRMDEAFELIDMAFFTARRELSTPSPYANSLYRNTLRIALHLFTIAESYDIGITYATQWLGVYDLEVFLIRGQMYRAIYEWDSALNDFNAALELDPAYAETYYQRGLLYASILQTGAEFYDEALADFQHYLELAPDGEHAAEAAQYIADLESQQQSLNDWVIFEYTNKSLKD